MLIGKVLEEYLYLLIKNQFSFSDKADLQNVYKHLDLREAFDVQFIIFVHNKERLAGNL